LSSAEDTKNVEVKKRKIRKTDWQKVEAFLKKELETRKSNPYRKSHERKWKEIDRQIAMEPMQKLGPKGKELPPDWQSAFELGELSKASEVISADVMRLSFPQNRTWMEAHVRPPMTVTPQGKSVVAIPQDKQRKADGVIRSLMTQQHSDFGLKARVELSVKEALHHGSFVATCEWEQQNKVYDGQGLESLSAPVWKPHSMWNCYPDSSPSVIAGANIFYTGSMMIVSYMPRYKVLALSGDGYMNIDPNKIPKKNPNKDVKEEDCEIVTYYGDLVIEREDGDIYLPNSKCKTANGTVIYYKANDLPFPEVIYQGYERQDIRDPYFTSPIEKNSPMQKMVVILTNEFIDGVRIHNKPPITYDSTDPALVANGGINFWPGGQTAARGGAVKYQEIKIGDPKVALLGVQFGLQKIEEGTSVNAIRSGASESDRKTATEVTNTQQGSEIRTVDFVGKLEQGGLKPFLYMQHERNLRDLKSYSFYCPEKNLPDFLTITDKELKDAKVVHFEVVGSKGVLGEQRRAQQMTAVTFNASQNPLFAPLLNAPKILIDMYEDAGVKGAEEYVLSQGPQIPPQAKMQMQQMQQALQEMQQKLQEAEANQQAEMAKVAIQKRESDAKLALREQEVQWERRISASELSSDRQKAASEIAQERQQMMAEMALKEQQIRNDFAAEMEKIRLSHEARMKEIENQAAQAKAEAKAEKAAEAAKPKTVKIKRTKEGYEAS
jgi:hypothetical protein